MKLWQKDETAEAWVTRFTVGEDYRWDTILLPYDVEGTRAHAWALGEMSLLDLEERASIESALDAIRVQIEAGEVVVRPEDEDAHTVIENLLTERLGETGKKIHTGRSRNDQVLVALRLFLRDAMTGLGRKVAALAEDLCALGERTDEMILPGYTHYQRAMPSTVGLWATGYAEMLVSDLEALRAAHAQIDRSPWGSAAGYGVPHLLMPRDEVAARLGFAAVQRHATTVQLSRGKLELHVAHAVTQLAFTINRLASDLVLYSTSEFGFVKLPDEVTTGSSIMPQKKNPDVLELARAMYHRLTAELHLLLSLPANLPSGYHRDLQLTKEAVMRSVLLGDDLVSALLMTVKRLEFQPDALEAACSPDLFATAQAIALVREGVPFREAYRRTAGDLGSVVAPPAAEALAAYSVAGYPGRSRPEEVRAELNGFRKWLEGEV